MFRKDQKLFIYVIIGAIPLLLIFFRTPLFTSFKFSVGQAVAAPTSLFSGPIIELKKFLYYRHVFSEYLKLRRETNTLRSRIIGLEEVMRENNRLQQLLNFKRKMVFASVAAKVVGRDPTNWNASIIIDRGRKDGIAAGMPVVNDAGVVGRVSEVGQNRSRVILLIDPQFSVPALVQNPRESGLISGSLQGICRLRYLPEEASVQIGDTVITSSLSLSFPDGLLIGKITGIRQNPNNPELEYIVQPAVSLSKIEEVLVIQK